MDKDVIYLVQQYKYLGILLDENLKFDLCDDLFAKSGEELYYLLYQSIMLIINYHIFTQLFYKCI